ncbi:hypothetical protein C8R44DRAFT_887828 [Mycena epipterygia]|nr:hypothetical protein C8R44DRAFT_887828 [Mycena epipterygia]
MALSRRGGSTTLYRDTATSTTWDVLYRAKTRFQMPAVARAPTSPNPDPERTQRYHNCASHPYSFLHVSLNDGFLLPAFVRPRPLALFRAWCFVPPSPPPLTTRPASFCARPTLVLPALPAFLFRTPAYHLVSSTSSHAPPPLPRARPPLPRTPTAPGPPPPLCSVLVNAAFPIQELYSVFFYIV